jgi:DNA polymerase-3 subunit delta'
VDALQKLCHDLWAMKVGAAPRFFAADTLPAFKVAGKDSARGPSLYALGQWTKELNASARTAEHPYNPGLMLEALVSRAQLAMRGTSA